MAKFEVVPKRDQVLVERIKVKQILSLLVPDKAERYEYHVRAIGDDVEDCEVGDEVVLRARGTAQLIDGMEDHALVSAGDVLAVIKREPERLIEAGPYRDAIEPLVTE